MSFKYSAEFIGRREVKGPLSVKTISECTRVLFVSVLQKGSTTRVQKLPVDTLSIGPEGLEVTKRFKTNADDLIFCHIDEKNRRLVVFIIRLKCGDQVAEQGETQLSAFVWKCDSTEDANALYQKFHEVRQNHKMTRQTKLARRLEHTESVDSSSVSSDSAIESGSCPSSTSSPNVSSDECSDSVTSETPSERKLECSDSEDSSGQESIPPPAPVKVAHVKRRAPEPPVMQQKPRSRSVPASKILMELTDKDGMEHKHVISARNPEGGPRRLSLDTKDEPSAVRIGRSRQREAPLVLSKRNIDPPNCKPREAAAIENIVRKLIPKDIRTHPRYGSLPRDSGIVSFAASDNHTILIPTSSLNMNSIPTQSAFDPKKLTPAQLLQRSVLYHPTGSLDYKQWRHATGLDRSKGQRSTFFRVGRHIADSRKIILNVLKRPLLIRRSNSMTSRASAGYDSSNEAKLRSVMKKGQSSRGHCMENAEFGNIEGQQDKKNVTFNSLTRVQVVDCK